MKKLFSYSLLAALLFTASCDKGFDELNTNKTSPTSIDPVMQLNTALNGLAFPTPTVMYDIGIVQQMVTPNSGVLTGANFNQDNRDNTQALWQNYYRNVIRNTRDVLSRINNDPGRSNLFHMTRIAQAFGFMVLTDAYGEIPYTQGGNGYSEQVFFPEYDAQQTVYNDIIKELSEAAAALNPAGRIETSDVLYGGNVDRWKKFAYSIMLRAGMRLSKVDPTKAQQTVQAAVAGGVITSNLDNAVLRHDANFLQPIGNMLNATEAANIYLTQPFVDYLRATNDPRLQAIAIRYVGAKSGPEQTPDRGDTTAAKQIGMPLGYDNAGMQTVASNMGLASFYEFSQVDRRRMTKPSAPSYYVTAGQTNLLLAEARQRNWITTGTAKEYFDNGVRAHMLQLAGYDPGSAVSAGAIDAYLDAHPFDPANALEQINTQYWIASFLNGPEAWANFRRTGYPALTPNPFPGKDLKRENFIRRLTYPNSEVSVNKANYDAAVARMKAQNGGTGDDLDTRVWWDKP